MVANAKTSVLNEQTFSKGLKCLARVDQDLARVLDRIGLPPMWERETGFPTLLWIILEQQVSLASAKAAFDRVSAIASPLTPRRFLKLNDETLKRAGFSCQKASYGRHLAMAVIEGRLDLFGLHELDDVRVRESLMSIKGIGIWTADIYLLMAMRRADIWPRGDLALAVAMQRVKRLSARPTQPELDALSLPWRPWRAVAARVLWHFYLSR